MSIPGPLAKRILSRLETAEIHEPNPHLQTDYRIAWITVLYASRGYSLPHVSASYQALGCHPDEVWPRIVAHRKAHLGTLYEQFFAIDIGASLPPKKPARSVRFPTAFPRRADRAA